ncbi:hypothetical protein AN958_08608 [Leucoagaricus sp. SymC.cos]|nr:hypothetical protein AN958_08608 [Leucoagaricus sp. SymC.cos]
MAKICLRWISVHSGVEGNEVVDIAAKEAAKEKSSKRKELPSILKRKEGLQASKAAIKQEKKEQVKKAWEKRWKESPRYARMMRINPNHPYKKFRKWKDGLSRNQGSILTQLRSRHLPINTYLKKIQKCKDDYCE